MASCAACSASAPRWRRAATSAQVVLVPESAHGTNPATAAFAGYRVENIPANPAGRVDLEALKARLGPDVAAVMITNPNTCGLFEPDMKAISDAVHAAGGFVYCDGANFNAIVGKVRPGDLGIDAMHINLHKTFSTPHGGGGPGSGPVVLSEALSPYGPLPFAAKYPDGSFKIVEEEHAAEEHPTTFGRMVAFHGQMGMFTRALSYILSHGADGLRQVAEDAVLNANYILRSLEDVLDAPFGGERAVHARSDLLRPRFRRRAEHDRCRQGADRRGLPPDDHVLPAGRARRDAGRADRDGIQGEPRPVHPGASLRSPSGRRPATRASRPRRSMLRAGASTRRSRRRKPVLVYKDPEPAQAAE